MDLNDLSAKELAQVDAICLDYERRLRAGERLSIDDIVSAQGGALAEVLRNELHAIETELAQQQAPPLAVPFETPTKPASGSSISKRDTVSEGFTSSETVGGLPTVGATIGPYLITGELGRGRYGRCL